MENKLLKTLENLELLRDFIKDSGKVLSDEEKNIIVDLLANLLLDIDNKASADDKRNVLLDSTKNIPEVACLSNGETKCPYAILCGTDITNSHGETQILCKLINMMAYSYDSEEITLKACPIKKLGSKIEKIIN